jgi:hypothetical protein
MTRMINIGSSPDTDEEVEFTDSQGRLHKGSLKVETLHARMPKSVVILLILTYMCKKNAD